MDSKGNIIFDFDGTIAESEVLFKVMNELSLSFGYAKIKKSEISSLRKMTISELMNKFNISFLKLPSIIRKAKKLFREKIKEVKPILGMDDVLSELEMLDYDLIIVTSNNKTTVEEFLKIHKINCFRKIYGNASLHNKAKLLKRVIAKEKLNKNYTFHVGDEIRDIDAAKDVGIRSVAVSWGFNSREVLQGNNPDHLLDDPKELLGLFK